ncbi:MAG: hypothetical protein ACYS8W_16300 [Planctomycetota bacterium]|jgi:hypothetical protein
MNFRTSATLCFITASFFAVAAAVVLASPPALDINRIPPGYAIRLSVSSAGRLLGLGSAGAQGKLLQNSPLRPALGRISPILDEEIAGIDRALSKMRADISCAEIGSMLLCGSLTVAAYPGEPGDTLPRFLFLIELGNNSPKLRTALGRIAAYIDESETNEIKVKASPVGKIPCHKWTFREPPISIYTAYFAGAFVVSNDLEIIGGLSGRKSNTKREPSFERLKSLSFADKADAVIAVSAAELRATVKNRPSGGGVLQRLNNILTAAGITRIVWSIREENGAVRERAAIEGPELPESAGSFRPEMLAAIPAHADAIHFCAENCGKLFSDTPAFMDAVIPELHFPGFTAALENETGFNPVNFMANFASGPIAGYASFTTTGDLPGFALISATDKSAVASTLLDGLSFGGKKRITVPDPLPAYGNRFVFRNTSWEPYEPAVAVLENKLIFASSETELSAAAGVNLNSSCAVLKPLRAAASRAPLNARAFTVINLDSLAAYGVALARRRLGDDVPAILSERDNSAGTPGYLTAAVTPVRDGVILELDSGIVPGIPLLGAASFFMYESMRGLRERRIRANENAAQSALRSILVAQELYKSRHGKFASDFSKLSGEKYIDDYLASGLFRGYIFGLSTGKEAENFRIEARPVRAGWSGRRIFIVDETGRITEK